MKEIVIGADGYIGSRLRELANAEGTSRKNPIYTEHHHLDLLNPGQYLPFGDIYYLCAGVNGFRACEGNPEAWRVNVDATLWLVRSVMAIKTDAFVVWISSSTVQWSDSAYARQKAHVEAALGLSSRVGIVRAGRVINENRDDLCRTLLHVGRGRVAGLTVWGSDEPPYKK